MALRWATAVSSLHSSQAEAVFLELSCSKTLYPSQRTFTFRPNSTKRLFLPLHNLSSTARIASFRCFSSALTPDLKNALDKVVTSNKVVLFMKGTKDFPQCGFSNTVVQILNSLNVPFETINILDNEMLRLGLKEYSNWPTFPQLYIEGEFFGGCDITVGDFKGINLWIFAGAGARTPTLQEFQVSVLSFPSPARVVPSTRFCYCLSVL
ncbi:PREDICTED: monothiol glutaredoxin-S14, chloroplastic isoform X1 [Theobroma cacao]|uniref:Monothiol glutaredoxin-S14, chloroplastic isoform X1 n=1 Tax=Theobroma cacao TaxID=3641 RepID=A0AB32URU3_THECC|nr:PREDICTED: monothiol glutaredoxin-S14, chloroplastic isoform X1 [Theobroma cacao]